MLDTSPPRRARGAVGALRRSTAVFAAAAAALVLLPLWPVRAAAAAWVLPVAATHMEYSLDCEAAALQSALTAKGIAASQDSIIAATGADLTPPVLGGGGVLRWGDPYRSFVGLVDGSEPAFTGYGVYAPALARVAEQLGVLSTPHQAWTVDAALASVERGDPVVSWVIAGLGTATTRTWIAWDGTTVPYAVGEHAVTLAGVDRAAGSVLVADPQPGTLAWVPIQRWAASWAVFGNMAVDVGQGGFAGVAPTRDGGGYLLTTSAGRVVARGDAVFGGDVSQEPLSAPVVGIGRATGSGYWLAASDGGVFALGGAGFLGSMGGTSLNRPVVAIAATPDGRGYWLVASDGGVFSFGAAGFFGSMGGRPLNAPVVGMAATRDGLGYWLVAADGGVFSFGDAGFFGSMGGVRLAAPIVALSAPADGGGYRLAAADGGVFAFGASFQGGLGGRSLAAPVTAAAATPDGRGYWLLSGDGGVFAFGDAPYLGGG